jgi:hypothetical protein
LRNISYSKKDKHCLEGHIKNRVKPIFLMPKEMRFHRLKPQTLISFKMKTKGTKVTRIASEDKLGLLWVMDKYLDLHLRDCLLIVSHLELKKLKV